ncbi:MULTISPECIES: hypothetical protein [Streptosporangium]|uniref:DNA-binding protein (UPF0251 family) n=1 Tax=Streptosporangium brasiliense TaxID=47480 RepID=A0ABT9RCU9_9ACTN|nr:hypothetical protein [Streptosporangium brasiliense]MDP9867075.1 putative DNA-binding protein (UPF0251 family) [Streptosporangium brasiliense]
MTATKDPYWLAQWVDEYEVQGSGDIDRLIRYPGPIARLVELAKDAPNYKTANKSVPDASIVAGSGLDLSGKLSCGEFECVQRGINDAFVRIWHYFDRIIVEGASPRQFLRRVSTLPKSQHFRLIHEVKEDVKILLYLREIGAEKYLIYREKPLGYCNHHFTQHAAEHGLDVLLDEQAANAVVERLAAEAEISTRWFKGVWNFWVTHPFFSEPALGSITRAKKKRPSKEEMIGQVFRSYSTGLVADMAYAKVLNAPLAKSVTASWVTPKAEDSVKVDDVAFHLQLPFIEGMAVRDIISLREDEQAHFVAFRKALRTAIQEQIKQLESASPQEVARSVVREYVEPALADIQRRLKANTRVLSLKAGSSAVLSLTGTSVGLLGSLPLIIAGGVAAAGTALPHFHKYFEEKREIELSDMYFLWSMKKASMASHRD